MKIRKFEPEFLVQWNASKNLRFWKYPCEREGTQWKNGQRHLNPKFILPYALREKQSFQHFINLCYYQLQ